MPGYNLRMTGYSHINSNELVVVSFVFNYFTGLTVSSSIKIKLDALLFPGTIVTLDTNGW